MVDIQVEFLTNYEALISYLLQFSTDWSKFNPYQFDNNLSKKNIIGVLDSFTETKVTKDDFYQWFVELFLKFIELRPKNLSLFDDGLALKVLSFINTISKNNFKCGLGAGVFSPEQIETLNSSAKNITSTTQSETNLENNHRRELKNLIVDDFVDVDECKSFIMSLMNKIERYKHHLNIYEIHKNQGSTPSSLFFSRFSPPFLSDDSEFVEEYNNLIREFQKLVMTLITKFLNNRLNIAESKLTEIKDNLIKSNANELNAISTIDQKLANYLEITKNSLEDKFKFSVEKARRCENRPFIAGINLIKKQSKKSVDFDTTLGSVSSSTSNVSQRSILKKHNNFNGYRGHRRPFNNHRINNQSYRYQNSSYNQPTPVAAAASFQSSNNETTSNTTPSNQSNQNHPNKKTSSFTPRFHKAPSLTNNV